MKFSKTFIIFTLSSLSVVRLGKSNPSGDAFDDGSCTNLDPDDNGPDKDQLNAFLDQIQQIEDMKTTKLYFEKEHISLDDYFVEHSGTEKPKDNKNWTITREGMHRTGFMIHILVSCKYTEFAYYWLKLIENQDGKISENTTKGKLGKIQELLFKPLKDFLKPMIITLVGLLKYTKHYASKHHEILTVFLNWYIYIKNFVNANNVNDSEEKLKYRLNSIQVANFQIERFLKQFLLHNCKNFKDFEAFRIQIEGKASTPYSTEVPKLILQKTEELNKLTYNKFLSEDDSKLFILAPDRQKYNTLVQLIKQQLPSDSVLINWDLSLVYDRYYADTASDVKSVLKFERVILQTITKIIIGYVSNILKTIKDTSKDPAEIDQNCKDRIVTILNKYIEQFKKDNQPSYLIHHMSIINTELMTIYFNKVSLDEKKSRIDSYIEKLNELNSGIEINATHTEFEKFLESLSQNVICTQLNPLISNAFWEKLYFAPTSISEYVTDFKYIHLRYEIIEDRATVCATISNVATDMNDITSEIKKFEKDVENQNKDAFKTQFDKIKELYAKFKAGTENTILKTDGVYHYNWKKLLLTVEYNLDVLQLLEGEVKNFDAEKLESLHNHIVDYFQIGYQVTCHTSASLDAVHINFFNSLTEPFKVQSSDSQNAALVNDVAVVSYKEFFKNINKFIKDLSDASPGINDNIKLFWDGIHMKLVEIWETYTAHTIDALQENYEHVRLLARWLVSVMYTRARNILDGILSCDDHEFAMDDTKAQTLRTKIDEFMKLPLFIDIPVKQTLNVFIDVLVSYDGNDTTNLKAYDEFLAKELDYLGVLPYSQCKMDKQHKFDVRIDDFGLAIEVMNEIYKPYKTPIQEAINKFGINQEDHIMMLHEWYRE